MTLMLVALLWLAACAPTTGALLKHNPDAKRVVVAVLPGADVDAVARAHGYVNLGELESLSGYHVFEESDDRKREVRCARARYCCCCCCCCVAVAAKAP